jgi:hypothetical protein
MYGKKLIESAINTVDSEEAVKLHNELVIEEENRRAKRRAGA